MDWITDTIAIGNYLEAQDTELLRQAGIQSVLSLDGTVTASRAQELGLAKVVATVLVDGPGNELRIFRGVIESLLFLAEKSPPVLVQCHAGRSRSVAAVAGYLMRVRDIDADDAIRHVAVRRPSNLAAALKELLYRL